MAMEVMHMVPNYIKTDELNAKIQESGLKLIHIANNLGIHSDTLRAKINGEREFSVMEMVHLSNMLGLSPEEREHIFFGNEVAKK